MHYISTAVLYLASLCSSSKSSMLEEVGRVDTGSSGGIRDCPEVGEGVVGPFSTSSMRYKLKVQNPPVRK